MQQPLGLGFLFFNRAVIQHVTVWLLGIGTKLRLQPHMGESVGEPSAARFF